jgi:3-oxoacyl-[acyl-carrier protein] reductase
MKLKFSGGRALILGGSCELGIFLSKLLINNEIFPVLTYRNSKNKKQILDSLNTFNDKFEIQELDLSSRSSILNFFNQIDNDKNYTLDYMIDFIQGDIESYIASINEKTIYNYFNENISIRAEILKKITRIMLKKKKGRLIFISSSAADRPNPGQGYYAAAKLASEALYRNIGLELGCRGITTVTLRPGYIKAGRGAKYIEINEKQILDKIPTKKILTINEVCEVILFFLSNSAMGFNCVEIPLDGGLTSGK